MVEHWSSEPKVAGSSPAACIFASLLSCSRQPEDETTVLHHGPSRVPRAQRDVSAQGKKKEQTRVLQEKS